MELINHIEKYLGKITSGESITTEEFGKLQFLKFENQPFENIVTYSTLGLSNHILNIKDGKDVRMELIASVNDTEEGSAINDLLHYIAHKMLINHKAILRGQVIPIPNNILRNSFESVYVSIPVFFEEEFASLKGTDPDVIFAWVFPLFRNEADFIQKEGWNKFEDYLQENEIDNFWDLKREEFKL